MSNLTGSTICSSYGGVLNIGGAGLTGALTTITDGFGNPLPMQASNTTINFTGNVTGVNPPLAILDQGSEIVAGATGIDFVGPNITVTATGSLATVTFASTSGSSGTSGQSGSSGTSGVSGSSGTSGVSGSSGTSGVSGSSGTSGNDGTSGTSGVSGTSGTSGISGSSGTSGVSGSSGTSGNDGTSGTSGANGTSGTSGSDGSSGTSGISGSSGTSGVSGSSGTSGTDGSSGTSGQNGTSGTSGQDGSSGTSGISGSSGTSGVSGSSGTSGNDGTSGTSGQNGTSGTSGLDGSSGTSGADGSSGTSGVSGSSGTSGVSGSSGTSGVSGSSGTSGLDGTSGTSGLNGAAGTSGTSGISGTPSPIREVNTDSLESDAIGASAGSANNAIAIGANAIVRDNSSISLGPNNDVCGIDSIALGNCNVIPNIVAGSACNIFIGYNNQNLCQVANPMTKNIQIGNNNTSCSNNFCNVIIGSDNNTTSFREVAIGSSNSAFGDSAITIGFNNQMAEAGTGIGVGNSSSRGYVTILGFCNNNAAGGQCATLLGQANTICGNDGEALNAAGSVAIGLCNRITCGTRITTVGYKNCLDDTCGRNSVILGNENYVGAGATGSIVLGNLSVGTTGGTNSILIGNSQGINSTPNKDSVVVGSNACILHYGDPTCIMSGNIVIGKGAKVCSSGEPDNNIAIGTNATTFGNSGCSSIAIGTNARTGRFNSIAIGNNACTCDGANIAIAIGSGAVATGELSMAIGYNITSINYSVALGYSSNTNGFGTVGLGALSTASCQGAVSIGANNSANGIGAVAIGNCATACHAGAYVFASCKTSEKADTTHVNNLIAYGQGASKWHSVGNITGNVTVDWDNGNNQSVTLTGAVNLGFSNPIAGANYGLSITQGGAGGYAITWTGVKWANATPPTLSAAIGSIDFVNLVYDGTTYYGTFGNNFA